MKGEVVDSHEFLEKHAGSAESALKAQIYTGHNFTTKSTGVSSHLESELFINKVASAHVIPVSG